VLELKSGHRKWTNPKLYAFHIKASRSGVKKRDALETIRNREGT